MAFDDGRSSPTTEAKESVKTDEENFLSFLFAIVERRLERSSALEEKDLWEN